MEFIFIANTTISDEHRHLASTVLVLLLLLSLLQLVPPGDSRMFVLAHLLPCPVVHLFRSAQGVLNLRLS